MKQIFVRHLHSNVLYRQKTQWLPGRDPGGFSTTCWLMAHKNVNYTRWYLVLGAQRAQGFCCPSPPSVHISAMCVLPWVTVLNLLYMPPIECPGKQAVLTAALWFSGRVMS